MEDEDIKDFDDIDVSLGRQRPDVHFCFLFPPRPAYREGANAAIRKDGPPPTGKERPRRSGAYREGGLRS